MCVYMYMYTYTHINTYIYIYQREREKENNIYIYIYIVSLLRPLDEANLLALGGRQLLLRCHGYRQGTVVYIEVWGL